MSTDKHIKAKDALAKIARYMEQTAANQPAAQGVSDTTSLLRTYMLATISTLNDMLQDIKMKRSLETKRQILKSLSPFIEEIGPPISAIGPQVDQY